VCARCSRARIAVERYGATSDNLKRVCDHCALRSAQAAAAHALDKPQDGAGDQVHEAAA
jgi:hypothetical protein